jgi:hypothetical protein
VIEKPGRNGNQYADRLPIPHETANGVSAGRSEVLRNRRSMFLKGERLREEQPEMSATPKKNESNISPGLHAIDEVELSKMADTISSNMLITYYICNHRDS